jgi:N-carbamoyl-L-amino-acid hydrolase
MEWWDVTIKGKANHAGTTPMNLRQDAMRAAGRFIVAANELVRAMPGEQVLTIGQIAVEPGAVNVIPEKVTLSLEIRDLSKDKIFSLFEQIKQQTALIEKQTDTRISFESQFSGQPAITDKTIQGFIAASAKELGYSHKKMPSGAGHDAQDMARITPIGMIFVPSKNGISHSPLEYTSPGDMANGANVLFSTVLKIDKSD